MSMMPLTKDPAYIPGRNLILVSKNVKMAVGATKQTTNNVVEQALGIMGSSTAGYYHGGLTTFLQVGTEAAGLTAWSVNNGRTYECLRNT
jgi:hypothetical protein